MAQKVVLLLGAGATLSDVATRPLKERPPLDRQFFATTRLTEDIRRVARYMDTTYGIDITAAPHDSLEAVMGRVYTDISNDLLRKQALAAFQNLLKAFNGRLAHTTNNMRPTNKRLVYRILSYYLWEGIRPEDITIITFNQDIQVEKHLWHLTQTAKWSSVADDVFCFPGCYKLSVAPAQITGPTPAGATLFRTCSPSDTCLAVLKLHGSLNWYSIHNTPNPSHTAMFKPDRNISITTRQEIDPSMMYSGARKQYTLPIVVPPVSHKSAVLHDGLRAVWHEAELRLRACDRLIVFGYSCPPLDFESQNLLRRASRRNTHAALVEIIDPDPSVVTRYADLLAPSRLYYYSNARAYLQDR